MSKMWLCQECGSLFRRGDGTHCPDCGMCEEARGHMGCDFPTSGMESYDGASVILDAMRSRDAYQAGPAEVESNCPVCGDPMSYCQGHGILGDPDGYRQLVEHDEGNHKLCHPAGCDRAGYTSDSTWRKP